MNNSLIATIVSTILVFNIMAANADDPITTGSSNNVPVVTTNSVTIQATLNDVVIDILRGAKSAGAEVYNASKSAVVASVDFAKNQVPDVVEQFIKWKITERVVYVIGWLVVACFLYVVSRKIKVWSDKFCIEHPDELHDRYGNLTQYETGIFLKWATRVGAIAIITFNIWFNGMTIAKILIAPKVFLIEYVVDTINSNNHTRNK